MEVSLLWQIAAPLSGALGFGMRYVWERWSGNHERRRQVQLEETRFRLEEFYLPIYYLVREDTYGWKYFIEHNKQYLKPRAAWATPHPVSCKGDCKLVTQLEEIMEQAPAQPHLKDQFWKFDANNLQTIQKVQEIITKNIVKARPPPDMVNMFDTFHKHATVYGIMRSTRGDDRTMPYSLNAPYPKNFHNNIKQTITQLMEEYDILCKGV